MSHNFQFRPEATPSKIVGIYLTELDHVMVKVRMSDRTFMNFPIGELKSILPEGLSNLERDLSKWRFVPCQNN